jgi:hypothetical protein
MKAKGSMSKYWKGILLARDRKLRAPSMMSIIRNEKISTRKYYHLL